ncbi:hypothetical protein [Bdellovibrio sp. KM01]|uniref:hypothetical protein n=1 Tax=Bdellovibrio sp. KM01 TaxID=2748865 RepID=UPI001C665110|nr:hypothetical protein [Bdellovibrio sp. KM01]
MSSPIWGTYTTYLVILHWKVFVVLFSPGTAGERIEGVEEILNKIFWLNVCGALGLTLVTLLLLPFLKNSYDKFLSDREANTTRHVNRNNRNVERENSEAENSIKQIVMRKTELTEVQNICDSLKSTLDLYERVIGIRGGHQAELKSILENHISQIISRIVMTKSSVDLLAKDAKSL